MLLRMLWQNYLSYDLKNYEHQQRFSYGMDLKKNVSQPQQVKVLKKPHMGSLSPDETTLKSICSKTYREPIRWYCHNCALVLTSELQAQEHFVGKKHQNVLKNKSTCNKYMYARMRLSEKCGASPNSLLSCDKFQDACYSKKPSADRREPHRGINNLLNIIPPPAGRDNILETVIKSEKRTVSSSDLSIYRTPSGKYYCQPCNLTVNSQAQFLQHSESRKHRHKASKASFKIK